MPEKFCSTCRNTGFVVLRDQAETIRITKTRCPHCPSRPRPIIPPGNLDIHKFDDENSMWIAWVIVAIGTMTFVAMLAAAAFR